MRKILIAMSAIAIALTTASASNALTMSPYSCRCCQPLAPICCPAAPVEPCCENPTQGCCPAKCNCPKHKKHKKHHKKACGCQTQTCKPNCGCGCQ